MGVDAQDDFPLENVPVVDMSLDVSESAALMRKALQQFGFFYVKNHGVPMELIESMFGQSKLFFDLPLETKVKLPFKMPYDTGYAGFQGQLLDYSVGIQTEGDFKESFNMSAGMEPYPAGKVTDDPLEGQPQQWPEEAVLPEYKGVMSSYFKEAWLLNARLNRLLAVALGLPENFFEESCDKPWTVLKTMHYNSEKSDEAAGKFGAGAHCDWGTWTLLATDSIPGLQVFEESRDRWLNVPPLPGCIIVNSGDLITRMTNGKFKSALHRVYKTHDGDRYSTPFFCYPNLKAIVEPLACCVSDANPPKFPAVTTADYFFFKLTESGVANYKPGSIITER